MRSEAPSERVLLSFFLSPLSLKREKITLWLKMKGEKSESGKGSAPFYIPFNFASILHSLFAATQLPPSPSLPLPSHVERKFFSADVCMLHALSRWLRSLR